MLHLMKLAVGIRDIAQLREVQAERLAREGRLCHLTRNYPRRAQELSEGGSIYWVIGGAVVVRQRIREIRREQYADGSPCAALHLDQMLQPVVVRPVRAFQGWRYLKAEAAPADVVAQGSEAGKELPEALWRELRELGLV